MRAIQQEQHCSDPVVVINPYRNGRYTRTTDTTIRIRHASRTQGRTGVAVLTSSTAAEVPAEIRSTAWSWCTHTQYTQFCAHGQHIDIRGRRPTPHTLAASRATNKQRDGPRAWRHASLSSRSPHTNPYEKRDEIFKLIIPSTDFRT